MVILLKLSNPSIIRNSVKICQNIQKRDFVRLLTAIANKPDRERIKTVGAERACAEWLLRCGAAVRWDKGGRWNQDYNSLPAEGQKSFPPIHEVLMDGASVMDVGFEHFDGCKRINRLVVRSCPYITDNSLRLISLKLAGTLEAMVLLNCGDVTDKGVMHLKALSLLKSLKLGNLPEVRDPKACVRELRGVLVGCEVVYEGLEEGVKE